MLAESPQNLSKVDYTVAVKLQFLDGGSAYWCQATNVQIIVGPSEVVKPIMFSWMKERNGLAIQRIRGMNRCELVIVASLACKGQIRQFVRTAARTGHNVFHRV